MKKSILAAALAVLGLAALVPVVGFANGSTTKANDCCAVKAECCPNGGCCGQ